jgi:hypothetical protein
MNERRKCDEKDQYQDRFLLRDGAAFAAVFLPPLISFMNHLKRKEDYQCLCNFNSSGLIPMTN